MSVCVPMSVSALCQTQDRHRHTDVCVCLGVYRRRQTETDTDAHIDTDTHPTALGHVHSVYVCRSIRTIHMQAGFLLPGVVGRTLSAFACSGTIPPELVV